MNFANHVDRAASNTPVRPAVGDSTDLLTYGALARETNAVANAFERLGVRPGDRLGLLLSNRLEFLTSYLGAMKQGTVPVPINTRFGRTQIQYALDTSDVSAIVTDSEFEEVARSVETAISVDGSVGYDYRDLISGTETEREIHPRRSEETAEVLYTSGTTGRPKGVRHTHGNVGANAMALLMYLNLTHKDVGLTACQCFHVTGLNVTTTPLLLAGAENRLVTHWDAQTAFRTIEDYSITYAFLTPEMVSDLIEYDHRDRYDLSSLSTVVVGGAPIPEGRLEEAERTLDCSLLEGYGMTETTPLAAFNRPDNERRRGSVGPPAREVVALRIEDPETKCAVGRHEKGELLWRGDTVTPGYERRRNDGAFVEREGHMWLRSGDIGWMDDDGYLFITDRREDMFTTGCANVYPREIEGILYDLEYISEAAVIDVRDELRGAVVTAVLRRTSDDLTADRVREFCADRLEDHEIPQRIEFVEAIPRTTTGKIDRVALRNAF